jgi:hypothetical protein
MFGNDTYLDCSLKGRAGEAAAIAPFSLCAMTFRNASKQPHGPKPMFTPPDRALRLQAVTKASPEVCLESASLTLKGDSPRAVLGTVRVASRTPVHIFLMGVTHPLPTNPCHFCYFLLTFLWERRVAGTVPASYETDRVRLARELGRGFRHMPGVGPRLKRGLKRTPVAPALVRTRNAVAAVQNEVFWT